MELTEEITITVIVLLVLLIIFVVITFCETPSNMVKCTEYVEDRCSTSNSNSSNCESCDSCKYSNFTPSSYSSSKCVDNSSSSYTASSLSCYPSPIPSPISSRHTSFSNSSNNSNWSSDDYSKTYSSSYEESYNSYLKSREEKEENIQAKQKVKEKKSVGGRRCKIPQRIIQTYRDRELPIKMFRATETFKEMNPDYEYKFYDNEEARNFIEKHFVSEPSVLRAYDSLIPGAFKADIFRLCELYVNGGFYVDVSMVCIKSLSVFDYIDADLILVKDIPSNHIYNAFIGAVPKNQTIKYLLDEVVSNVLKRNMGLSALDITGPQFLGRKFKEYVIQNSGDLETFYSIVPGNVFISSPEKKQKCLILDFHHEDIDHRYVIHTLNNEEMRIIKNKYEGWKGDRPPGSHYSNLYKEGKVFK